MTALGIPPTTASAQGLVERAEGSLQDVVNALVLLVEAAGALVIGVGATWAFVLFARAALSSQAAHSFVRIRLVLGRFLALGLEFQLASDVLKTAVSPTLEQIGQLAAIAAIRTALNFFLSREIAEERRQLAAEEAGTQR